MSKRGKQIRLFLRGAIFAWLVAAGSLITGCSALVNKAAFFPDREHLLPPERLPAEVQPIWIGEEGAPRLAGYLLRNQKSDRLLIFFHGNAGNLDHRLPALVRLHGMGISVLGVEYRGYGRSEGKPTEKGIYADGGAAYTYAREVLGYAPDQILLLGRSIGSTVAVHVAAHEPVGGVILVSPLTSAKAVARHGGVGFLSFLAAGAFNNLKNCADIRSPTLIIHGEQDSVIPFTMGEELYQALTCPKTLVKIPGADHNDLDNFAGYWESMQRMILDY